MDTVNIVVNSDPVRHDDLRALAEQTGPVVSLVIPTHRGGAETLDDRRQLPPLLDAARKELKQNYPDADADAILKGVAGLADDELFWQRQADALVVFANASGMTTFRTTLDSQPQVSVGDHPNLRPLLPLVADDQPFLLLAVSQEKVRLFEGDRYSITELDLGDAPASTEDSDYYTREPQFQHQSGREAPAHGHSTGEAVVRDSFLRDVAKALNTRFTNDDRPLILASVDSGNPDELTPTELHAGAWPLAADEGRKRHEALLERFGENIGTGRASHDSGKIGEEAGHGRVDTLILTDQALREATLGDPEKAADLDAAVVHTLRNKGTIDVVSAFKGDHTTGAIFRF